MGRRGSISWLLLLVLVLGLGAPLSASAQDERTVSSANFALTWDDDDPATRPLGEGEVPRGAEEVLDAFERARAYLLGELEYEAPPEERHELFVGTDPRGFTRPGPGEERSRGSFTVVPARFVQTAFGSALDAFAVHEYFHAIQYGYDTDEPSWVQEATASWVEDEYLDAFDPNHRYLPGFVPRWRQSLTSADGSFEYGAFLFVQYLIESLNADADLVREWWTRMAHEGAVAGAGGLDAIAALESLLADRDSTLSEAWGDFLLWRRRLAHFEEGTEYKEVLKGTGYRRPLTSTRVDVESCRLTFDGELQPLSGEQVVLRPRKRGPARIGAVLTVVAAPGATGALITKDVAGDVTEAPLVFDSDGNARVGLRFGRAEVRKLTVLVGNGRPAEEIDAAYSLRIDGRSHVEVSGPVGPGRLGFGSSGFLFGAVTCGGEPAEAATVLVRATEVVSGEVSEFLAVTDEDGRWSIPVTPAVNTVYTVEVLDPLLSSAVGGSQRVDVAVLLSIEASVEDERRLVVTGQTSPAHPDALVELLYRRPDGRTQLGPEVAVADDGSYRIEFELPGDGTWEVRTRMTSTGDEDHVPGSSAPRFVTAGS